MNDDGKLRQTLFKLEFGFFVLGAMFVTIQVLLAFKLYIPMAIMFSLLVGVIFGVHSEHLKLVMYLKAFLIYRDELRTRKKEET